MRKDVPACPPSTAASNRQPDRRPTPARRFSIALTCGLLGLLLLGTWALGAQPGAAQGPGELTVCPAGPPDCDYAVIQDAVDDAAPGGLIKVASGVYTATHPRPSPPGYNGPAVITQVVYITRSLTIRGGYSAPGFAEPPDPAANPTTIDAGQAGRTIFVAGDISATLDGLRLTGGWADGLGGSPNPGLVWWDCGGGLFAMTATLSISNTSVYGNRADEGGGIVVRGGRVTIRETEITTNTSDYSQAGGMLLWESQGTIENSVIRANHNTGLEVLFSDGYVTGSTLSQNMAQGVRLNSSTATLAGNWLDDNGAGGLRAEHGDYTLDGNSFSRNEGGSGVAIVSATVVITGNLFYSNTAGAGGGVVASESTLTLHNNTILSNTASMGDGGGLLLVDSVVEMVGNLVRGNRCAVYGGGLSLFGSTALIDGNEFSGNVASAGYAGGGGMALGGGPVMLVDNVVVSNSAANGGGLHLSATTGWIENTLIAGNQTAASGGGVWFQYIGEELSLANNVIAGNHTGTGHGALHLYCASPHLLHTTIAGNEGGDGSALYLRDV